MQRRASSSPFTVAILALTTVLGACKKEPVMALVKHPAIDQQKVESLYRSAKAIQASLSVGLTNSRFQELRQAFATEIAIAKDKAKDDRERELVAAYAEALSTLQDSDVLWRKQIADAGSGLTSEGETIVARGKSEPVQADEAARGYRGTLSVDHAMDALVTKYGLKKTFHQKPTKATDDVSRLMAELTAGEAQRFVIIAWESVGPDAVQTIWTVAGKQLDRANGLYYAEIETMEPVER